MPRISAARRADRRDQILDAAVRCFATGGFHATGMADVIAEAGMSAGGVYRHFGSKAELIHGIVARLLDRLQADLATADPAATSLAGFVDAVTDVATRVVDDHAVQDARLLPQVWTEALRDPGIAALVRASYGAILETLTERTSALHDRGALPDGMTPRGAAHLLLAVLQGSTLQRLLLGPLLDQDALRAAIRASLSVR